MVQPPVRACSLVTVLAALAGAADRHAGNAALGVACPSSTSRPFTPWGDTTSYWLVPNGGLENGATAWTLTGGAAVVGGNESFAVQRPRLPLALLPAGSTATTPPMCIGLVSTKMRFFASNSANPSAKLQVQAVYHGGLGQVLGIADYGTVQGGAWHPSQRVAMLGGLLPLLTQSVQFKFHPVGSAAGWRIDDAYFDPLLHR